MKCHVRSETNGICFVCAVNSCWNISGSDDCFAEGCTYYGTCEHCEFALNDAENVGGSFANWNSERGNNMITTFLVGFVCGLICMGVACVLIDILGKAD